MISVSQGAYNSFISRLEESARLYVKRQLEANTSPFSLSTLMMRVQMMDTALGAQPLVLSLPGHLSLEPRDQQANDLAEEGVARTRTLHFFNFFMQVQRSSRQLDGADELDCTYHKRYSRGAHNQRPTAQGRCLLPSNLPRHVNPQILL